MPIVTTFALDDERMCQSLLMWLASLPEQAVLIGYMPIIHQISRNLEPARYAFRIVRSLWNFTGISAVMPKRLSNFTAIRWFEHTISRLQDFARSYVKTSHRFMTWWRHQIETFFAFLFICARNSSIHGEFPIQRPVTRSFDVFFDMRSNKRLSKQSWG